MMAITENDTIQEFWPSTFNIWSGQWDAKKDPWINFESPYLNLLASTSLGAFKNMSKLAGVNRLDERNGHIGRLWK